MKLNEFKKEKTKREHSQVEGHTRVIRKYAQDSDHYALELQISNTNITKPLTLEENTVPMIVRRPRVQAKYIEEIKKYLQPLSSHGDNLAAHWVARTKSNLSKTKHYDLKHHFVAEAVASKLAKTAHIDGSDNVVDFLTKIQTVKIFLFQRDYFVAEDVADLKKFVKPVFDKSDLSRARDA